MFCVVGVHAERLQEELGAETVTTLLCLQTLRVWRESESSIFYWDKLLIQTSDERC